ncbi:MAG: exosortase T [Deltaproteobacteria bacterium]|nr:exosortase T [Deltaproteobacteria bacterium]
MNLRTKTLIYLLAAPGFLFLALDPVLWLIDTWFDPTWDSQGFWVALAVFAMVLVALKSGPAEVSEKERRLALGLLVLTALLRLAGRLLAIRGIGALALVADLAAIGLLLGLGRRPWALNPWALAGLFAFSLPVELWLQRILGYPLRLLSAEISYGLLSPFVPELKLQGTLLLTGSTGLAVDLPCSGAQGLMMLSALTLGLLCRRKASFSRLLLLVPLLTTGALLSNSLRILFLFLGQRLDWAIFTEPLHSALGLLALSAGALFVLLPLSRFAPRKPKKDLCSSRPRATRHLLLRRSLAALGFTAVAALVASAPAHPIDTSGKVAKFEIPRVLAAWRGQDMPLSPIETHYFAHYGGQATKRLYRDSFSGGSMTLILVRTTSPLRHLHGPERCLAGAGHKVQRLGVLPESPPAVSWRSVDPEGRAWNVRASFLGPQGESAASLGEVVWRWMGGLRGSWTLAERISPEKFCQARPDRCRAFDAALFAAL